MLDLLQSWCSISSSTFNYPGMLQMADALSIAFGELGDVHRIEVPPAVQIDDAGHETRLPLGPMLRIVRRPDAPVRVLLVIHYDTVYPANDPFDRVTVRPDGTWNGPGVVDAKGGIAIMLGALRRFEQLPIAERIGWEVLLNPDEEIGSPSSGPLLVEAARRASVGLLFEPALPDGNLVGERKGSGNFTVVVRGKAAHAGRDFAAGRSAVIALAKLIANVAERSAGMTLNCGQISGGSAVNVVPEIAIGRFNARASSAAEMDALRLLLIAAVAEANQADGISATVHGDFTSPPKPLTPESLTLLQRARDCGREMGLNLSWRSSGGTCDGNRLAAAGLPLIDTLGPVGGNLHSPLEYLIPESLEQRTELVRRLLIAIAET